MFNHIRKVPYVAGDGKGGISYFAGGFQNQFGMETQIVAAMCTYCLAERVVFGICELTDLCRWHLGLRNDCTRAEGSPYVRS